MIDLHTHTRASDGIYSARELAQMAKQAGLSAIAITDHDTLDSAKEAIGIHDSGIEIVPGIEISVYDRALGYTDIHVLGLLIDPNELGINSAIKRMHEQRQEQKIAIIEKLKGFGFQITFDEVKAMAPGSVGRPHIARVLLEKYPEKFEGISDVFKKYLDRGKPAFVTRKEDIGLKEAIGIVHEAGGIAVLAHPVIYEYEENKLIDDFISLGGDGIETVYDYASNYSWKGFNEENNMLIRKRMERKADALDILQSGGSDFHGPKKGAPLGKLDIPDRFLEAMKDKANH
jgi:hypothetical protein